MPNKIYFIGVERYSDYSGYGDTFTWSGNYIDTTPFDDSCRRKTSLVAIDATHFTKTLHQYNCSAILRELNKVKNKIIIFKTTNLMLI